MNDLTDENFSFQFSLTLSLSSSFEVSIMKDWSIIIVLLGSLMVMLIFLANISFCCEDNENKEVKKIGRDKQVDEEKMNVQIQRR